MKKIYLVYPKKIGTIAPEIYGHFSEHIGGVIYDGLWVGKDSKIPKGRDALSNTFTAFADKINPTGEPIFTTSA